MAHSWPTLVITLLLSFAITTTQVTIRLTWTCLIDGWVPIPRIAQCTDLPPGECCKPHPDFFSDHDPIRDSSISVTGLLFDQIAAGWSATWAPVAGTNFRNPDTIECSGAPVRRFFGPGTWWEATDHGDWERYYSWEAPREEMIFGASWVDLRTRFPPDSKWARYLQWQGVNGRGWGRNTWSAASGGVPFSRLVKRERLNGWAQRGMAYIRPPVRWRYPDLYEINGTNYTKVGVEGYRSSNGASLDLTNQ